MRNLRLPFVFVFALVAAACGGGGGSSTPPVPGGGGPPPPGGSPSASPSVHPSNSPGATPTPVPTPVQTPTPVPTSPGSGNTILPDTNGRFGLTQILDWNGLQGGAQLTQAQIDAEAPNYDSVWGAFSPQEWDAKHPGMIVSRYYLPNEDSYLISQHNLAWWQANHNDWILYACDANNNPTQDVAWYDTHFGDVPLNIHNPAVVDYQVRSVANYMIQNGYNTLAVDNVIFENYGVAPNPDLGEGPVQKNWYGCGIYTQPNFQGFQQVYSGGLYAPDPNWIADMKNWLATARQIFTTDPVLKTYNLHLMINHPVFDSSPDPDEAAVLNSVDAMVDENGFTHYDDYENPSYNTASIFSQTLGWMEWAQANNKAILLTDYYCRDGINEKGQPCSSDPSTLTAPEVDWGLSTYAIGNNGGADVYLSPNGGATYSYRSEYATRLGTPCGGYTQSGGVYVRKFAYALVVVNPNQQTSVSYPLPANHQYTDIEHQTVTNPLVLNGPAGYVLMTTNGCS